MRGAGSFYLILVGLLFMAAGGGFAWLMWRSFDRASGQRDWKEAEATILASTAEERKIGPEVGKEYRLSVLYGYRFEGKPYSSERYSLRGSGWSSSLSKVEKLAEKFPPGSSQTCYVNPADPAFAVLKRDSKAPGYSLWFPLLFVLGGLGMIVGVVRSLRRARGG